jgi:hypothetical protein
MTGRRTWEQAYHELADFVVANPSITISRSEVRIPEHIRPEFYRRFDDVRSALAASVFGDLLELAAELGEKHAEAEKAIFQCLRPLAVNMPADMRRFLSDPQGVLVAKLFGVLFDLLKGTEGAEALKPGQMAELRKPFVDLYESAFQIWLVLSLLAVLDPDRIFSVHLDTPQPKDRIRFQHLPEGAVPPPEESGILSFIPRLRPNFAVPDFIVHSAKLRKYVGFLLSFSPPVCTALNASHKRSWTPLERIGPFPDNTTLVYVDQNVENLGLVADKHRICRPDVIIGCVNPAAQSQSDEIPAMGRLHQELQPSVGTFAILHSTDTTNEYQPSLHEHVRLLKLCLDQSKLKCISDALTDKMSQAGLTSSI